MGELAARNCLDYATLTVSSTAVDLTSASPAINSTGLATRVKRAIITVETDQVRWRADGTAPTASEGHLLSPGDNLQFLNKNYETVLNNLKFIRVSADAALKISYFD